MIHPSAIKNWSLLKLCTIIIASPTLCSCSKKNYASKPPYQFKSPDGLPHYKDLHYWAAHPWKWDPSDSIPKPLRSQAIADSSVDVFFIYPTTFLDVKDTDWNAAIDDATLNAKTDYTTILLQASAFNNGTRLFAPRYRQAHFRAFTSNDKQQADAALALAYSDVKKAFEYYLAQYNNGRPIIIASHSQGTIHAANLLKEFFEGKPLQHKLVCAYIIGMPVKEDYFTTIPSCKDSLATGCVVSWRSYKSSYEGEPYVGRETYRSIVINPLSWTNANEYMPASANRGAVLFKFNKIGKGVGAQVHNNILWTTKPRFFGNIFFSRKNYHIADINMFYMNIRQNVQTRIRMFRKN